MPRLKPFGQLDDLPLVEAVLESGNSQVSILSLGAITRGWRFSHDGRDLPVVLGYGDPLAYLKDSYYLGVIAGRVANRTAHGRFRLAGQDYQLPVNNGPHHLHGGPEGLHRWNFTVERDTAANAVELRHVSPHGHGGYPGEVSFTFTITLDDDRLIYDMRALPDRPAPINLAQHSYYNLSGEPTCLDHEMRLEADAYTPTDASSIPTGAIESVEGTRYDFRDMKTLREADPKNLGLDMNLVLREGRAEGKPAAVVRAPDGLTLQMFSAMPGLQVYNSMHMGRVEGGHDGVVYDRFAGIVLEPQAFPNVLNTPSFGDITCTPEQPYRQILAVDLSAGGQP